MMRSQLTFSITALALIFPLTFISCADNADNDTNKNLEAQAHIEQDFVSNPNLVAHPDRKVVAVYLEPETAEESENLTGDPGFDVIPYHYTDPTNQTFCWEDPNADSDHMMKLFDSEGQELAIVTANGECTTLTLLPGRYEMHLFHDNKSDEMNMIFINPNVLTNETTKLLPSSEGLMNNTLQPFSMLDTSPIPQAQSPTPSPTELSNLKKLIKTNNCDGCDLRNTDIVGLLDSCPICLDPTTGFCTVDSKFFVNLSNADLTGATIGPDDSSGIIIDWCTATIIEANFTNTTIQNVTFYESIMSSTVFSNSSIDSVSFFAVTLSGAKFVNANISNTSFEYADMSPDIDNDNLPTDFTQAMVNGSDFQYVIGIKTVVF